MIIHFGAFEYDSECRELRCSGVMLRVEPQVFDLLGLLLENRDRIVCKNEIFEKVWKGRIVSDAAISSRIMAARKALGDDGRRQVWIKTVHGSGFRFVGKVTTITPREQAELQTELVRPGLNMRELDPRASLVVLPIRSLDTEPASTLLAEALHDDLTTQLARMPNYQVVARGAALLQPSAPASAVAIGRDLGVGYVVSGSVRTAGEMIRLTVRVSKGQTGNILAAVTFDRRRSELLALQNLVIYEIANTLDAEIELAEVRRLEQDAAVDPSAFLHFRRAQLLLDRRGWNRRSIARVIGHLQNARQIDPDYAPAISMQALITGFASLYRFTAKPLSEVKPQVLELAEEGVTKDPHRSNVLSWSGCAYCDVGEPDRGKPLLERALEIDPSNAQGRAALGWCHILKGEFDDGIQALKDAIAISPNLPGHAFWLCGIARGHAGKNDRSAERQALEDAVRLDPTLAMPHFALSDIAEAEGDLEAHKTLKARAVSLLELHTELA